MSWFHKGSAHLFSSRWEEARKCYEEVIRIDPTFDAAYMNLGIIYAALDQIEESLNYFDKALEINPKDDMTLVNKGNTFTMFKRFDEGLACFDKALKINPKNVVALANKGATLSNLNRNKKALKCFNKALKIDPNYKTAQEQRQIVMNRLKKQKAPKLNTDLIEQRLIDLYNSGAKLLDAKRFQEAVNKFSEATRIAPLFDKAWFMKASCLYEMGRFNEALKSIEESLRLEPNNANAWYYKGNIIAEDAMSKGDDYDFRVDFGKAIECFDKALKINPKLKPAWDNKRILLYRSGRTDEYNACRMEADKFLDD